MNLPTSAAKFQSRSENSFASMIVVPPFVKAHADRCQRIGLCRCVRTRQRKRLGNWELGTGNWELGVELSGVEVMLRP